MMMRTSRLVTDFCNNALQWKFTTLRVIPSNCTRTAAILPTLRVFSPTTSVPEEVGHALSAVKIFLLNFTVPGYYTYWYGAIQSDSHYIDYCLGREGLDMLISIAHD